MVPYTETILDNSKQYSILKTDNYGGCQKCWDRALKSIHSFLETGAPVSVISPETNLDKETKEEYRKFFCKEAKIQGRNMVYFEGPVIVQESNGLEDTMFAD